MTFTAGVLSQVSVASTSDSLASTAASGGTTPYTYQWYRHTVTAFTPAASLAISSATLLTLSDSGLTPGTIYYYKVVGTDSAATPVLVTTAQLAVTTLAPSLSQNQFQETAFLGMTDLRFNGNTMSVQFDPAGSGTLVGGQAVKWSTVAGGVPKVVPSLLAADVVAGFVNYDIKSASYAAGDRLEISLAGNVMFLYAALAINRGAFVTSLPAAVAGGCNGGVIPVAGSNVPIAGYALDTAAIGALCRIFIQTPSNAVNIG